MYELKGAPLRVGRMLIGAALLAGCVAPHVATSPAPKPSAAPVEASPAPCVVPTVPAFRPVGVVWPSFEQKENAATLEQALAGGEPDGSLSVIFLDPLKVRVRSGEGTVRGANGYGLVALSDMCGAFSAVEAALRPFELAAVSNSTAQGYSEAQMDAEEVRMEQAMRDSYREAHGQDPPSSPDFPHRGSWASLRPVDTSPENLKALALALSELPAVRGTQLSMKVPSQELLPVTVRGRAFDAEGQPYMAPATLHMRSLSASAPFEASMPLQNGVYVVNQVPVGVELEVRLETEAGGRVERRYTALPTTNTLNFGGPPSDADPDAPNYAIPQ